MRQEPTVLEVTCSRLWRLFTPRYQRWDQMCRANIRCALWFLIVKLPSLQAASSPFLDWFHPCPPCLLPAEALSSRPGISTGTPSASCVLTVTSTSSRRAISSWRGSCTVRPMREPVRDPQKATTPSLCTPKPESFADENTHACTHAHLHWPTTWMALAEGVRTVTSQSEATAF